MYKILLVITAGIWGFAFPHSLQAQALRRVTLDDCLRMAESHNLDVRASRVAVQRAKALQGTAFDPEKTSFTLSQDPTSGGSPDNALSVSQTLAFPTVYAARRKQLKEETQLQHAQLQLTTQEVGRRVCQAYSALLYTIERQRIAERQATIYQRFLFLAEAKLKYGEAGKLEWMNARRLAHESATEVANLGKDVETARHELQTVINCTDSLVPANDSLVILFPTVAMQGTDSSVPQAFGHLLDSRQQMAQQGVKIARQEFMPDITLSASIQMLIHSFNPYDVDRSRFEKGDFMGFEVGLSVPLFYGAQRARLRAAKQEQELVQTQITQQRQQYVLKRQTAQTEWLKAQAKLQLYQEQGGNEADEMERISQVAYEKGSIGYVEYIQNLQAAANLRNARADAIHAYNMAIINLRYLTPEGYSL